MCPDVSCARRTARRVIARISCRAAQERMRAAGTRSPSSIRVVRLCIGRLTAGSAEIIDVKIGVDGGATGRGRGDRWLTSSGGRGPFGPSRLRSTRSIVERWSTSRELHADTAASDEPTPSRHRSVGSARRGSVDGTQQRKRWRRQRRPPKEKSAKKLRTRYRREKELEAYQVELLKLQKPPRGHRSEDDRHLRRS